MEENKLQPLSVESPQTAAFVMEKVRKIPPAGRNSENVREIINKTI